MVSSSEAREIGYTPPYKLVDMIKHKKISPVEVMAATLRRIEELNPRLNAYLTVAEEQAMKAAHDAEKALMDRVYLGPLHGIPISVKDLYPVNGMPVTQGSLAYQNFVADTDDTMVQRLRTSGAIIVGKTNTPEFGLCGFTENKLGDACRNPWNLEMHSGGSSGGAAASVAAGITSIAQSSDGGGSTRIPASFCGVFGLKGSYGRVPKQVAPWGVSIIGCKDATARTVKDVALVLNVIAGPDGLDYSSIRTAPPDFVAALDYTSTKKLRVACSVDLNYGVAVDSEVKAAFESAVQVFNELGHNVEEAAPATNLPFETWDVAAASWYYIPYGHLLDECPDDLMDYTRLFMELGRKLTGEEVTKAWMEIGKIRGAMRDFFEKYDILLTPTTAVPAPPVGARGRELGRGCMDWEFFPFTCVFNFSGNPAASVPCGFSSAGLPIGLQIVGRPEDEATVLHASAAFEETRPWVNKRPPVS